MKLTLFLFAGSAVLIVLMVLTYWQVGANTFDMAVWSQTTFTAAFQYWAFLLAFVGFGVPHPDLPAAHVVARRSRRRPDRSVDAARRRPAQARRVRPDSPRASRSSRTAGASGRCVICVIGVDQHRLRRAVRDEPDRPEVRHRLLEREPHGLRAARHRDRQPVRAGRRRLPDVRARHHDGAVLRAHRLRVREVAHPPDRRHLAG